MTAFMVPGMAISHLARRGLTELSKRASGDKDGQPDPVALGKMIPFFLTILVFFAISVAVSYTIGHLVVSLAMIESPSSIAITDSEVEPPSYSEYADGADSSDPDGERERMIVEDGQVEPAHTSSKPITSSIRTTIKHIRRIGGFFSLWRGAHIAIAYTVAHSILTQILSTLLRLPLALVMVISTLAAVLLIPLHVLWTHSMIAKPSGMRLRERMVSRNSYKVLLLPTVVYAVAQNATVIVPTIMAFLLRVQPWQHHEILLDGGWGSKVWLAVRDLLVVLSGLLVAVVILIPASATLTRIEAAVLPEGQETIVSFNNESVMEDLDMNVWQDCRGIFVKAWRSFDRAALVNLVKVYVKLWCVQFVVGLVLFACLVVEVLIIGPKELEHLLDGLKPQPGKGGS